MGDFLCLRPTGSLEKGLPRAYNIRTSLGVYGGDTDIIPPDSAVSVPSSQDK